MIPLYLKDIAQAVGGKLIGDNRVIKEITTDSRKIGKDAMFVAIRGDNLDGHDFIGKAVLNGVVSVICHKPVEFTPHILVDDTRKALLDIAAYYRSLFSIPVIAVTGSAGKTSVKNGISSVLSQKFNVLKTDGNFNNEIGLPLTVFNLNNNHNAAVLEMGMNSFGEISRLSKAVKPSAGVITNVGTAHIERLKSREGILKAKLEIVDGMDESSVLILNYDDDMLRQLKGRLKQNVIWFSALEKADIYAESIFDNSVNIRYNSRTVSAFLPNTAPQLVSNALAVAAAGFLLGLSHTEVKQGLESMEAEKGRLFIEKNKNGVTIIDDCYNANPDSMRLAIDVLRNCDCEGKAKEKIAILGDMFELGEFARKFHEDIGRYVAESGIDALIAIGKEAKYYQISFDCNKSPKQKSFFFKDKQDFINSGINFMDYQAVLVKASRGMRLDSVVEFLKI